MTFAVSLERADKRPLDVDDVEEVMEVVGADSIEQGWILRERDREPWCCVFADRSGPMTTMSFDVSYSSPNLLRNAANAMELAVKAADMLGAIATEDLSVSEGQLP